LQSQSKPNTALSTPSTTISQPTVLPLVTRHSPHVTGRRPAAFTLIELLVVIAIIAILASLAFPAVQGALYSARKAEIRSMANQIKLAISSYYTEYGTYPNITNANTDFLSAMTGSTNATGIPNRRGIRFLEVPAKFTNASGIVTPPKFYSGTQSNFSIVTDTNYDGRITLPDGKEVSGSVAVWVRDPKQTNQFIGTW
jgi:prepilin-type N-terminal cleavage/methylation domain-containing protein